MMTITYDARSCSFSLDLPSSLTPGSCRDCPQKDLPQVPEPLIPGGFPDVIRALSPEDVFVAQPPLPESLPKTQIDRAYLVPDAEFYYP